MTALRTSRDYHHTSPGISAPFVKAVHVRKEFLGCRNNSREMPHVNVSTRDTQQTEQQSLLEAAASELEVIRKADEEITHHRRSVCSLPPYSSGDSSTPTQIIRKNPTGGSLRCQSDPNASKRDCPKATASKSALFDSSSASSNQSFPPACLKLLQALPGNRKCVDCGQVNPQWASATYGVLLCLRCSGRHRGFGVQVSFVRSIAMDSWSHSQILSMLEGGNEQLSQFFERHSLGPPNGRCSKTIPRSISSNSLCGTMDAVVDKRYKTKAAKFYREQLAVHVQRVAGDGIYKGREAARKQSKVVNSNNSSSCSSDTGKSALKTESSAAPVSPSKTKRKSRQRSTTTKNSNEKVKQQAISRCNSLPPSLDSPNQCCPEAAAAAT